MIINYKVILDNNGKICIDNNKIPPYNTITIKNHLTLANTRGGAGRNPKKGIRTGRDSP
jgi:hypothetical protein